ncbi:MAG: class I SAM-dependent RNA methyltransferase [Brevinematia bacterium]
MEIKKYDEVEIEILEIGEEGICKGITKDSKEVFTRYAIPNETVKVKIFNTSIPYGDLVEIIKPSPLRIKPECKFFGECGGCDLQMLPYSEQLKFKKELIKKEFNEILGFNSSTLCDVIPSPKQYYYRNSVMFRVNPKMKKIGFLKRDTNIVVDIDECKISSEGINYALKKIKNQPNFPQHTFKVRTTLQGDITVNFIETDEFEDKAVIETIRLDNTEYRFKISRESFFQVNSYVIPIWLKNIRELVTAGNYNPEMCLDLYCGSGIISIFLSDLFKKIVGIEISKTSVEDGNYNIKMNNIRNVEIIHGDVSKNLENIKLPDVIVVNPSRTGVDEKIITFINDNYQKFRKPKKIIYSSCNYKTQARDIKLLSQSGLKLKKLVPIDMFPQTHHIEVIALIEGS